MNLRRFFRKHWLACLVALITAASAWAILGSQTIFPYLSSNNDEAVYLYYADSVLHGRVTYEKTRLTPFFITWFQSEVGGKLVFKYTPVYPAFLAAAKWLSGNYRFALGLAAGLTALAVFFLFREIHRSRRLALLATLFVVLSPLYILHSLLFLSYLTNLGMLAAAGFFFFRGLRTSSPKLMTLSGLALGIAAFGRAYDAFLVALPIAFFALREYRGRLGEFFRRISGFWLGLVPMLLAIGYFNYRVMGNPYRFPFNQSGMDSIGFGIKKVSDHETAATAFFLQDGLRAMLEVLLRTGFWIIGGPVAACLVVYLLFRKKRWQEKALYGILLTIPFGYIFMWSVHLQYILRWNSLFGPQYCFPMYLGLAYLSARGFLWLSRRRPRLGGALLALGTLASLGSLSHSFKDHLAATRISVQHYEPFEEKRLENAVVFVPPVMTKTLLHPFGHLRNHPHHNGNVVYGVDLEQRNFDLFDAYPKREFYRFEYDGPYIDRPILDAAQTRLTRLSIRELKEFTLTAETVNPTDCPHVELSLSNGQSTDSYVMDTGSTRGKRYSLGWRLTHETVSVSGRGRSKQSLKMPKLDPGLPLVLAAKFTCSQGTEDSRTHVYEYRFNYRFGDDGKSARVLLPLDSFHNPWFYGGNPSWDWKRKPIDDVLAVTLGR